jgi:crotonobetainyl-CoA hydratase
MTDITAAVSTNAAGEPLVVVERRCQVAIVTLNRPEVRNAVNRELTPAGAYALVELESDDALWVIIITGAGDKAFSAARALELGLIASGFRREALLDLEGSLKL